jgi:hypothetical protein
MFNEAIDGAIKEFISRLNDNYNLGEEGVQWCIQNLQEILYPLAGQLETPSPQGDLRELLQQLLATQGQQQVAPVAQGAPAKKRGTTGWMQFVKHMKEEEPEAGHNFQTCSPHWKGMSEEEKAPFNAQAQEINSQAAPQVVGAPTAAGGGKPKKANAWNQFCKDWKIQCDAEGRKYDVKEASAAYQAQKEAN